ncbi:hypothetical protein B0A48_16663 [Cryoendolithus antarcticus]|uniref:F-box domain-containing protein n=1 Tax=Cryoendolithus antarcticus TaxID=1507870 RepID=A0A1V8SEW4_9PEZI|nr:hypothetical protein B0A48_16663 [Cryoendolithus antarcticus]
MAAAKVLGIPELLEPILIDVADMKTLLLARRVNKTWEAVITRSRPLQEILFFERTDSGPARFNPLLLRRAVIKQIPQDYLVLRLPASSTVSMSFPDHSSAMNMHLLSGGPPPDDMTWCEINYRAMFDRLVVCQCKHMKGLRNFDANLVLSPSKMLGALRGFRERMPAHLGWNYHHLKHCPGSK